MNQTSTKPLVDLPVLDLLQRTRLDAELARFSFEP